VVADEIVAHDLVLDDVAIDMWRDDALADRVIPARHVADDGETETAGRVQVWHRLQALDVRDDETGAVVAHAPDEGRRRVAVRREEPRADEPIERARLGQSTGPRGVEKDVRMLQPHPLTVEAVPDAVADRQRVVADVAIEREVHASGDTLHHADPLGEQVRTDVPRDVAETGRPLERFLLGESEQDVQAAGQPFGQLLDDPAIDEHPRRERIRQDEPHRTRH
jgi:hypothetical protein